MIHKKPLSSYGFKKIKLTIIPPKQLFVDLTSDNEKLSTPSPTTTSSSPTPPNAPSKTTSTKETTSSHENTSSSFQSKLQVSPPPINEPTSPQPQNPFLQNLMDVPPRPSNHPPNLSKIDESQPWDSKKPVTLLQHRTPTPQESKVVKNDNVIALGIFRINHFKTSREEKYVPNKPIKASVMIKLITVSQPHVITKKDVNSDSNGLSSTRVNNIAKTRRPQPRSNIKNDRVPTASKSSCSKNKEVERENTLGTYYIPKNRNICHLNNCYCVLHSKPLHHSPSFQQNTILAYQRQKLDVSFLHVFGTLYYPKNDYEDIGKIGAKGDIGFFIGYSANSCAYRVFNRRTKKIIETMNVTFDELSAMAFEQRSTKPGLQSMTSGQISS
ncbi:hypothetical protein Tco_0158762 [Tanacetum coccineum]